MQILHCPCRCRKAFPAACCVGSGDVWPASLSLPSGSLLGLAGGKAQQETGGEVHQSGYLFPAGCTPGGFLSLVTAPQGSSSLDQHSHLWPGELLPSALPSDLGSHLYFTYPLYVHPDGLCNKRPLKYPNGLCRLVSVGTLVSHGDGEPEQRRRLGTCLGGRAKALRQAQWLMGWE